MAVKRLAFLIVCLSTFAFSGLAQEKEELSVTVGRTFVSTQTNLNGAAQGSVNPNIHFGNEESLAFNYSRHLMDRGVFAFSAELPVAIYPRMDLNTGLNQIPKDIGALFITPSLRVNFFPGQRVTPWASIGGGYTRFRESSKLNFFSPPYNTHTGMNTGAVQFGAGLDVWPWTRWGVRLEARDFYSGAPDLNVNPTLPVNTGRSLQHNYYVGVGVIWRF